MIETHGLRKTFKSRRGPVDAVAGVDLDVKQGEIFGFLGPNGAGKTTTLRMLSTLLPPTSGEATVAGFDLRQRARQGALRDRLRQPGGQQRPRGRGADRAGHAGPPLRDEQDRRPGTRRRARGVARALGLRRSRHQDVLRRPEAPPRHRHRPHAPSRSCSSSTSRPPGSTRRAGRGCGTRSAAFATPARRCS